MSKDEGREEMDRIHLPVCRIIIMMLLYRCIISFLFDQFPRFIYPWISFLCRAKFVQCVLRHLILFEEMYEWARARAQNLQTSIKITYKKNEMKNNFVNKQSNEQWKVCHVCCLLRDCDAVLCTLSKPWLRKMINKWKSACNVQHTQAHREKKREAEA